MPSVFLALDSVGFICNNLIEHVTHSGLAIGLERVPPTAVPNYQGGCWRHQRMCRLCVERHNCQLCCVHGVVYDVMAVGIHGAACGTTHVAADGAGVGACW